MSRRTARAGIGTATAALVLALGGCGGGDGDGGDDAEASPSAGSTQTGTPSPSPTPGGSAGPTEAGPDGAARGTARVALRRDDDLGKILAGPGGRTLYLFVADTDESTCYDACAQTWPPLTAGGEPKAAKGVEAGMLGTTQREDGSRQVTYNGHPLYVYVDDEESGETDGQGLDQFGAEWWAVDASGNKVEGGPGDGQDQDQDDRDAPDQDDPDPDGGY